MRFLVFTLCMFTAFTALADEKKYGSFILNTDIPDTLFFIDEIKPNDSFELRKALRNHDIQNIVLASPGGIVGEGLLMAGIIFDKKLRTYIPRGGTCASACAYLFFAGSERLADGDLGVHQAYSSNPQKRQSVRATQYATQFTVSEIIGFLNEFGTPAFVYEKMFQDIDMYFFDTLELMELNSETFGLNNSDKIAATKFIAAEIQKQKEKPKKPELTPKEIIAIIQTRLKEIGCNPGPSDGIWGRRTQAAAVAFAKKAGLPTSKAELISEAFIEKLSEAPKNYCPKIVVKQPNVIPSLVGRWALKATCQSNRVITGLANISSITNSSNEKTYAISFGNSLNQRARGTGYQWRSGEVTINLVFSPSGDRVQGKLKYKNGIMRGSDSNGCRLLFTKSS